MSGAWIIDAVRSPRGRGNDKGALRAITPVSLLGQTLAALSQRQSLATDQVVEAVFGCVTQTGEQGSAIGKLGLIEAGWSDAVPGLTLNR